MTQASSERVLLGLGSNVGDRRAHLVHALQRLDETPGLRVIAASRIWVTQPWGGPGGQQDFFNAAATVDAEGHTPRGLLDLLLAIELDSGRVRLERNGPRTLDLDILLYGNRVIEEEGLCVPHRGLPDRSFVLGPAAEIAAETVHPVLNESIGELARKVGREGVVSVQAETGWHRAVGHSQRL